MTNTAESQELGEEITNPGPIFSEMNRAGMELRGLSGEPHDFVAIQLGGCRGD